MLNLFSWFNQLFTEPVQNTSGNISLSLLVNSFGNLENEAIVTIAIVPGRIGQVRFAGSWWTARCTQKVKLTLGQVVYVVGRRNNTLYVEPGSVQ